MVVYSAMRGLLFLLSVYLSMCSSCQINDGDTLENIMGNCPTATEFTAPNVDFVWELGSVTQKEVDAVFKATGVSKKFIGGKLEVIGKGDLEKLSFKEMEFHCDVEIRRNLQLTNIEISLPSDKKLTVAGNPLLEQSVIDSLKQLNKKDSYIQDFGECEFDGEVDDVTHLEDCKYIRGDFVMAKAQDSQSAFKPPKITLSKITGCLRIVETKIRNVDFLVDLKEPPSDTKCANGQPSEISGNIYMWLHPYQRKKITSVYGGIVIENSDKYTGSESACDPTKLFSSDYDCLSLKDGNYILEGNGKSIHNLKNIRSISGSLEIRNTDYTSLSFPELTSITNQNGPALSIIDNPNLDSIDFAKLNKLVPSDEISVFIKGRIPKLPYAQMKTASSGFDIECDLEGKEVVEMGQLNVCTVIKGDLVLKSTKGKSDTKIKSISGCLNVMDTELVDLSFLDDLNKKKRSSCAGQSEITGNKQLCLTWKQKKKLAEDFGKQIEYTPDGSCDLPCDADDYEDSDSTCSYLNGDVVISGLKKGSLVPKFAQRVTKITGKLTVKQNEEIDMAFPQLEVVGSLQTNDVAIRIEENKKVNFAFPKLKTTETNAHTAIVVHSNDGLRLSKELKEIFTKASNGKEFLYECHETAEISSFAQLEGCDRMSSGLRLSASISGNPSPISYFAGCLHVEKSPLKNIDWLQLKGVVSGQGCNGNHVIKGNKDLCLNSQQEKELSGLIKGTMEISDNKPNEQCPVVCVAFNGSIPERECNVVEGDLVLENICGHKKAFKHVKEIRGSLTFSDCSMDSIKTVFPSLKKISSSQKTAVTLEKIKGENLTVSNLLGLQLESSGEGLLLKIDMELEIPYMDAADLKMRFGETKVSISKEGKPEKDTCVFLFPAKEVKDCVTVEGDLLLDENTKEVGDGLKEISGCLIMKKTSLKSYQFLKQITAIGASCRWQTTKKTEISGISCIHHNVRENVIGELTAEVNKEENKKECYECLGELKTGEKCHVVFGNVVVDEKATDETKRQLDELKEIHGRLVIKKTNMESISFKMLELINASSSSEAAIEVVENKKLKKLDLPSLKKMESKAKTKVKIAKNENLEMTPSLKTTLKTITGSDCKEATDAVCHISSAQKGNTEAPGGGGDGGDGKKKDEEEGGLSTGALAGIIIGAVLLLLICAGVGAFVYFRFFKKKKPEDVEKNGKGKKPPKKGGKGKKGAKTSKNSKNNSKEQKSKQSKASKSKSVSKEGTLSKEPPSKEIDKLESGPDGPAPAAPATGDGAGAPSAPQVPAGGAPAADGGADNAAQEQGNGLVN